MWAFKRRLNIVLLIIATIVCFVLIPYYLSHREVPTCFDGKKNQKEEGIDCGGGCALVCKGTVQDLKVLWTKIDEIRDGVYEVAFSVENPNRGVGARNIPYTATLFSENGTEVGTRSGTTYAGPNESFLVYEGNILAKNNEPPTSAEIRFGEFSWITMAKPQEMFSITQKQLTNLDIRPRLSALVRNDTPVAQERVEIAALVSDDSGDVVGYGKTFIDRILPGEAKPVTLTWTKPFNYQASLESCDVPVDVAMLIDRSGSMQSQGKEPPEPLTTVKNAASMFISRLRSGDQASIISFATEASDPIDHRLTSLKGEAKNTMLSVEIEKDGTQYTNTGDALLSAKEEFETLRHNKRASKVIILLTDGEAGEPNRPEKVGDTEFPKTYALEISRQIKEAGIALYAIGLGVNANQEFLQGISTAPEYYFSSPSAQDLEGIYQEIATTICKKAPSVIEVFPRVNNVPR